MFVTFQNHNRPKISHGSNLTKKHTPNTHYRAISPAPAPFQRHVSRFSSRNVQFFNSILPFCFMSFFRTFFFSLARSISLPFQMLAFQIRAPPLIPSKTHRRILGPSPSRPQHPPTFHSLARPRRCWSLFHSAFKCELKRSTLHKSSSTC